MLDWCRKYRLYIDTQKVSPNILYFCNILDDDYSFSIKLISQEIFIESSSFGFLVLGNIDCIVAMESLFSFIAVPRIFFVVNSTSSTINVKIMV